MELTYGHFNRKVSIDAIDLEERLRDKIYSGLFIMEVNFQISKHELKPAFIGSYTSNVSENSRYYVSVLGFTFSETQNEGFCYKEANYM